MGTNEGLERATSSCDWCSVNSLAVSVAGHRLTLNMEDYRRRATEAHAVRISLLDVVDKVHVGGRTAARGRGGTDVSLADR